MEAINLVQGIRDLHEHSAFKDYASDNPEWAESPEGIEKAISISPALAFQGAQYGNQLYEARLQRAGSRLTYQNNLERAAYAAYQKAGATVSPGDPEATSGAMADGGFNYAAAETAGRDMAQRYLQTAEDTYGPEFAAQLRKTIRQGGRPDGAEGVWDLNGYSARQPVYDKVMEGMRQDMPVVLTNPKDGSKQVVNMHTMPGAERAAWLKERAMYNPIPLKQGENIPEATGQLIDPDTGKPTGAFQSTRGGVTIDPRATAANTMAEEFQKHPLVSGFTALQQDAIDAKNALQLGTRAGDWTGLVKAAKAHAPGQAFTEGTALSAQQAQGLPAGLVQAWNFLLTGEGGKLTETMRRELAEGTRMLVRGAKPGAEYQRQQYAERAQTQGLNAATVTAGYHDRTDELMQDQKDPYINRPDLEPATKAKPTPQESAAARQAAQQNFNTFLAEKAGEDDARQAGIRIPDATLRAIDKTKLSPVQLGRLTAEYRRRGWL